MPPRPATGLIDWGPLWPGFPPDFTTPDVAYEITNLNAQRRCAKGHTIMATLDAQGGLLLVTPQVILDRL